MLSLSSFADKSSFTLNFGDVKKLFAHSDGDVNQFNKDRFIKTPMSEAISSVNLQPNCRQVLFSSNTSLLSEDRINQEIS